MSPSTVKKQKKKILSGREAVEQLHHSGQPKKRKEKKKMNESSERGSQGLKEVFIARNGEAHVVIEAEFVGGLLEQDLELRVSEKCDGDNVSGSILADVDDEMALGDVQREALLVVVPSGQAGAALQHLLQHCGLWDFGGLSNGHET